MINYFVVDETGNIIGIGNAIDISLITPPKGQKIYEGIVPDGANTYINNVFGYAPKTIEQITQEALTKRNDLLISSDWTQLPDVHLDNKMAWADYRQQLRDITQQPDYPNVIIWPIKPTEGA